MKLLILTLTSLLITGSGLQAQLAPVYSKDGKAIRGYDPVAFFTENKPVKGADSLSFEWNGAVWLFANDSNRKKFSDAPASYAPQYGGYCAYGTAEGHKAPTETETWTIVDGKLYFNYNRKVKEMWVRNQEALIRKADGVWPSLKDKE